MKRKTLTPQPVNTMSDANPLPLLGSGEKGLRIHDLVKAPANTPWAKAKQQSWDANEPATVYTTPVSYTHLTLPTSDLV